MLDHEAEAAREARRVRLITNLCFAVLGAMLIVMVTMMGHITWQMVRGQWLLMDDAAQRAR